MKNTKRWGARIILGIVLGGEALCAIAETQVGPVSIIRIRTGWDRDAFAIEAGSTIVNPARCPDPDAYLSVSESQGYKTYYAAALLAYATGKSIRLVISDSECFLGRPKIIGIYLEP